MLDSIKCVVVLPRFLRNYGPLRVCVKLELDNGQDLSHATFTTVSAMARFHASTWSVILGQRSDGQNIKLGMSMESNSAFRSHRLHSTTSWK